MWGYARKLEVLDEITRGSSLSEGDSLEIGETVKKGVARYASEGEGPLFRVTVKRRALGAVLDLPSAHRDEIRRLVAVLEDELVGQVAQRDSDYDPAECVVFFDEVERKSSVSRYFPKLLV
jgi:hypothetical protein